MSERSSDHESKETTPNKKATRVNDLFETEVLPMIFQMQYRPIFIFLLQLEATQLMLDGFKALPMHSSISMTKSMEYDIPSVLSAYSKFWFKVKSKISIKALVPNF